MVSLTDFKRSRVKAALSLSAEAVEKVVLEDLVFHRNQIVWSFKIGVRSCFLTFSFRFKNLNEMHTQPYLHHA